MEYVEEYIYLGQIILFEDRGNKEVNRRINSAWKKYWSLKKVFKNSKTHINAKRKLFDMFISHILTYGSQTWSLIKKPFQSIRTQENRWKGAYLE